MSNLMGRVSKVKMLQECKDTVLRFILLTPNNPPIPCEMRGAKVVGVLNDDDNITIKGRHYKKRRGVTLPKNITNLSTHSEIWAKRSSAIGRMFSFIVNLCLSIATGSVSACIVKILTQGDDNQNQSVATFHRDIAKQVNNFNVDSISAIEFAIGGGVALLVFALLTMRSVKR